jgi:transposase
VHSYYVRRLRDLPWGDTPVVLQLRVKRFRCLNPDCPMHTFAERLTGLADKSAQRTNRLTRALRAIGIALGGEAGQRLAQRLSMPGSRETLLRILRATPPLPVTTPHAVGVDDWAFRKAVSYGTILVDLETHHPVDLLPDRQADTLRDWLLRHPSIAIVARDRSTEYTRAIQAGAPNALQVADRWHVLKNLREAAERVCNRLRAQIDALPPAASTSTSASIYARATQRYASEVSASQAARAKRVQHYRLARMLKGRGLNILQIARRLKLARATARKYYYAEQFPERKPHRRYPSQLDPYVHYLQARFEQGCQNAMQLWREVQARGVSRGPKAVRQWVRLRRTQPAPSTPPAKRGPNAAPTPGAMELPSSRALSWILTRPPASLTDADQTILATLRQHPHLARANDLAQQFTAMTRGRKGERLTEWIQEAMASDIHELKTYALGLQADLPAIQAAMTHEWSNGMTEGHVNRLKLIKRQMYGRANFDLLRIRVLHASRSTKLE